MRRPAFSPIRFAAVLALLIMPACFSLQKVDVVRVIDNFERDAGLQPTWGAFASWTCGAFVDPDHAGGAGQDGGHVAVGDVDAGPAVSCSLAIGGTSDPNQSPPPVVGTVPRALVATFNLAAPYDVDVATTTKPAEGGTDPAPVSLTAFSRLLFDANLDSISRTVAQLPVGTQLQVELRCSGTDPQHPLVDIVDGLTLEAPNWKPFSLPFSDFTTTPKRQTCLANIDSIGFVVLLGSNVQAGTQVAGTLSLDDIVLE